MFDVFTNKAAVERLAKENSRLAKKMSNKFKSVLEFIKKKISFLSKNYSKPEIEALTADAKAMETVVNLFHDALEKASENFKAQNSQTDAGNGQKNNADVAVVKSGRDNEFGITEKDVLNLRSVGRKSINTFDNEDLKKAEKWGKKFYKELKEKSPFFRTWFGDWREKDKTLVKIASIPEYIATNEERTKHRGIVFCLDTQVKTEGWKINISREGETNTISHSGDEGLSEKGLAGIQELIENSVLLDTEVHEHHKNNKPNERIIFDHKLYALGETEDGSIALYKITVEEYFQSKTEPSNKKFHNLRYIEKIADNIGGRTSGKNRSGGSTNDISTINYSISDLFSFVKKYDPEFNPNPSSKVVNEDGTPMIMYHGTSEQNGEFFVFDSSKAKKKGGLGFKALGEGNYFTSKKLDGTERYGTRVIEAYLNIKNPFVYEGGESFKTVACRDLSLDENVSYTDIQNEMRNQGYDGVVQYDKNGKISLAVTFDSNQIKSVDNIGTFDGDNHDIRYSTKDISPIQAHYAEVLRENNNLRQIISALDEMNYSSTRGDISLNSRDIFSIASKLIKQTSSKYDKKTLADELTVLYDFMANNKGTADSEEIYTSFLSLANGVLEQSETKDSGLWEQYKDVRDYLRGQAVYITPQVKKEIASQFGDYKSFRNLLMGKMNRISTTNTEARMLDEVWQELSEMAPEYFPKDANELDMPMYLTAFYDFVV